MIKGSERDDGMPQGNGEVAKAGAEKDDLFVNIMGGARKVAVLTGAGASKESGIPTFREDNGVWSKWDPLEVATPEGFRKDPARVWAFHEAFLEAMTSARPHPGHLVLAEMEPRYDVFAIITQNIDNLHQEAGSTDVVELHGNGWAYRCQDCGRKWSDRTCPLETKPPLCRCGGMARPDVVWFGEALPAEALERALHLSTTCDVLLSVGTSATIQPAASIPFIAKESGARVLEFNTERTPHSLVADASFMGPVGETLPRLWGVFKERGG